MLKIIVLVWCVPHFLHSLTLLWELQKISNKGYNLWNAYIIHTCIHMYTHTHNWEICIIHIQKYIYIPETMHSGDLLIPLLFMVNFRKTLLQILRNSYMLYSNRIFYFEAILICLLLINVPQLLHAVLSATGKFYFLFMLP